MLLLSLSEAFVAVVHLLLLLPLRLRLLLFLVFMLLWLFLVVGSGKWHPLCWPLFCWCWTCCCSGECCLMSEVDSCESPISTLLCTNACLWRQRLVISCEVHNKPKVTTTNVTWPAILINQSRKNYKISIPWKALVQELTAKCLQTHLALLLLWLVL